MSTVFYFYGTEFEGGKFKNFKNLKLEGSLNFPPTRREIQKFEAALEAVIQKNCFFGFSITELVTSITNRPIPPHVRALVLEPMCSDDTGEDVEVPYVRYVLPTKANTAES